MGLGTKPFGKIASMHQKIKNDELKKKEDDLKKGTKKKSGK